MSSSSSSPPKPPTPSSGSTGYFLATPNLPNPLTDDPILPHILSHYIPQPPHNQADQQSTQEIHADITAFSHTLNTPQIYAWLASAEAHPPTFTTHSTLGHPRSQLTTSEGWRHLSAYETGF